jgi:hypothetical protein
MLHHISISVQQPAHVAEVIAELVGGSFFEFPVFPGAYMVMMNDAYGSGLEILPSTTAWTPGDIEAEVKLTDQPGALKHSSYSPTHLTLSVSTTLQTVEDIGDREGWLVRHCDRGPFQVIEFWVENRFMLEILTPDMMSNYLAFMNPARYLDFLKASTPVAIALGLP